MSSIPKIGFLGAGKMATALARGFIQSRLCPVDRIVAFDPIEKARAQFSQETGASCLAGNQAVVQSSSILFLAVKPDQVETVLAEISSFLGPDHLVVSIAAGVPIRRMEEKLKRSIRVVRVMPNTPALVGASATAFALGTHATAADQELVSRLFSAVGVALAVKEPLLDAVTGLSGSGPAYAYLVIEALSDGGVAAGLPRDVATRLAAQTLLGAAKMVLETGQHPGALKDMVTSPGGTTIEGLHELEKGNLRGTLINAVRAATEKSRQLGAK